MGMQRNNLKASGVALVVIAVIGILAALLLPVLGKAKSQAQGIYCMNNLKQLAIGWTLYSGDNKEKLMLNGSGRSWIGNGYLTWGPEPANTNTTLLLDPKFAAMADYVKALGVYKCPADRYQSGANPGPRVRSISMNGTLNNKPQFINETGRKYFTAKKQADLTSPGPSNIFVFLDEQADSIDDGIFMVNPGYVPGGEQLERITPLEKNSNVRTARWISARRRLRLRGSTLKAFYEHSFKAHLILSQVGRGWQSDRTSNCHCRLLGQGI